eukprot:6185563-Pleurochrysis_carterae.AAC.1
MLWLAALSRCPAPRIFARHHSRATAHSGQLSRASRLCVLIAFALLRATAPAPQSHTTSRAVGSKTARRLWTTLAEPLTGKVSKK